MDWPAKVQSICPRGRLARAALLAEDLALSERLSRMQGQKLGPTEVVGILQQSRVRHVLVGGHVSSAWACDPRASMDVDIIADRPGPACKSLRAAFPELSLEERALMMRFTLNGKSMIDIIPGNSLPVFAAALENVTKVCLNKLQVTVPNLETAMALKFAGM